MRIARLGTDLECSTKLIVLLSSLRFGLSPVERKQLEAHFCPGIADAAEQVGR